MIFTFTSSFDYQNTFMLIRAFSSVIKDDKLSNTIIIENMVYIYSVFTRSEKHFCALLISIKFKNIVKLDLKI